MTSMPVSNVTKSVQTVANTQSVAASMNSQKKSENFQDALNLFGAQVTQDMESGTEVKGADTCDAYAKAQTGRKQLENKPYEKFQEENKLSDDAIEKIEATGDKAVKKIAEELGVSEEDVEKALEELGLTVFDLSNANNMTMLMVQLLNLTDGMVMLTDSNLFETMTMLTQTVESLIGEVAGELQMPVEDLLMQLEEMKQQMVADTEIPVEENNENDLAQTLQDTADTADTVDTVEMVDTRVSVSMKETVADEQQTGQKQQMQSEAGSVQEPEEEVSRSQNNSSAQMEQSASENSSRKENEGQSMLNQNNYATFSNTAEQVFANQNVSTSSYSMNMFDNIMNQIGNYVDVHVTPEMTKMDIALTPENLGNVHIQVASKNGVITAQIATENEMVKQAVETQVVQLRDKLENQGIKVEAVEVTVASHEFERNLDENNQNREQEAEVKKVARKKWNLSDFEEGLEETEDLTETEKVELDMMKLSGNQLNYTV